MKNRRKIGLGQFWAFKAVSGTSQDALGTALGRPKIAPRPILGRPGRAKSGQEPSKSVPRTVPRRTRTAPERCPSAFGASSIVERARRTIFRCFCVVARKLRCVKNVAPANVLYTSHEVSTERAGATKKLENRGVSASQNEPGDVRDRPKSSPGGHVRATKRENRARSLAFFFKPARAGQSKREKRARDRQERRTVSYTHLTLPTILLV